MPSLVHELRKDHAVIFGLLSAAKRQGITTEEGMESLDSVRETFLAHLKREDTRLYPALRRAAESDAELRQVLDLFARDMDEISGYVDKFFEKYSSGGDGAEFAREFGWLHATLQARMRKEEGTLYRAFEKLKP